MTTRLLKLRAEDAEDIQVISAVLQDSIVPVCDMAFQSEAKSFVIVAQRLRRETDAAERMCCALTIKGVTAVQTRGIDMQKTEHMLDLLAILLEPSQTQITLIFGGDAHIRLDLSGLSLLAEDFGEPWPALCSPCHDEATARNP
jgi:hypothetical protein